MTQTKRQPDLLELLVTNLSSETLEHNKKMGREFYAQDDNGTVMAYTGTPVYDAISEIWVDPSRRDQCYVGLFRRASDNQTRVVTYAQLKPEIEAWELQELYEYAEGNRGLRVRNRQGVFFRVEYADIYESKVCYVVQPEGPSTERFRIPISEAIFVD